MRFLIVLMMAMMIGCGGHMWGWHKGATPSHLGSTGREIIPIYIDDSFTEDEMSSIFYALGEWNKVFNGQVVLRVKNSFKGLDQGSEILKGMRRRGEGWIIVRGGSDDEILSGISEAALAFAGNGIMVVVHDRIGERDLRTILMHEMGHLLGVTHLGSMSLMHPVYGNKQFSCIDKLTVSEMASVRGLRLEELNYCITPGFE